jgi:hypothetical protein
MKIPKKIKLEGLVSGAQLCHKHKMRTAMNNFSFARKEWPKKA